MTQQQREPACSSVPLDPLVGPLCSHCGFPLPEYGTGLRHYGTHTAHQESECLRLLHAEIERLQDEVAKWQGLADANALLAQAIQRRHEREDRYGLVPN